MAAAAILDSLHLPNVVLPVHRFQGTGILQGQHRLVGVVRLMPLCANGRPQTVGHLTEGQPVDHGCLGEPCFIGVHTPVSSQVVHLICRMKVTLERDSRHRLRKKELEEQLQKEKKVRHKNMRTH